MHRLTKEAGQTPDTIKIFLYRLNRTKSQGDIRFIKAVFTGTSVIRAARSMRVQLTRHLESIQSEKKNHLLHQVHLTRFDLHCLHETIALKFQSHVNQEVIKICSAW